MARIGDEVYLLKQGKSPRGIFGSGRIVAEPYRDDEGTRFAPISFDLLVDPYKAMLIDDDTVRTILEPSVINHPRSGISISEDAAASIRQLLVRSTNATSERSVPDADAFLHCLKALTSQRRLTDDERDMLIIHYNAPNQKITARQMTALLGWEGQWANTAYGKLGRKIASQLDWRPPETREDGSFIVAALVTGSVEDGRFIWTLRPEISDAMEQLRWPGLFKNELYDNGGPLGIIERKLLVWQRTIERNSRAASFAKNKRGFRCEACGMTFAENYGALGEGFIEAHHLYPLSRLVIGEERRYSEDEFAVLCSNCHRMIHRWHDCSDLEGFRKMLAARKAKL